MKILGVIPARMTSSRFPGKPLADIGGKPMIIHVAEKVAQALGKSAVLVATDTQEIYQVANDYGYQAIYTSENCLTGTDRLVEVSHKMEADIYLNIQGDEPLLDPNDINKVLDVKVKNTDKVVNAMCPLSPTENPNSATLPKVVFSESKELIYMSRLAIPGNKSDKAPSYFKQVCIYAFTKEELMLFGSVKNKTLNEQFEDIEILRFLDLGYPVQMVEVEASSMAVDTLEDLKKVREIYDQLQKNV